MPAKPTRPPRSGWPVDITTINKIEQANGSAIVPGAGVELARILACCRQIQRDSIRIEEAATVLGCSVRSVYRKLERHLLEGSWIKRHCFISLRSIAQYVKQYQYRPTRSFNLRSLRLSNQENLMDLSDAFSDSLAFSRWEDDGGPPLPEPCDSPNPTSLPATEEGSTPKLDLGRNALERGPAANTRTGTKPRLGKPEQP
jgi:hypothetical protein